MHKEKCENFKTSIDGSEINEKRTKRVRISFKIRTLFEKCEPRVVK